MEAKNCERCGALIFGEGTLCSHCAANGSPGMSQPPTASEESATSSAGNYCTACGELLGGQAGGFCSKCGHPVGKLMAAVPGVGTTPTAASDAVARKLPASDAIAIAVCATLTIIAAFLPWASVSFVSVAGTHGDGVLTLVVGVLGLVALLASGKRRAFYVLELLLACFVIFVGGFHVGDEVASTGVYLTFLAGIVWAIIAFLGVVRRR